MPIGDMFPNLHLSNIFGNLLNSQSEQSDEMDRFQDPLEKLLPLLATIAGPQQQQQQQQPPQDESQVINQMLLQRLSQPDENITRLNDLLAQMPQREKPSKMRRFGAFMLGMGAGPQAARDFRDEPYNEKLSDWGKKVAVTQKVADLDVKNQRDEMTAAVRGMQAETARKKEMDTVARQTAKLEQDLSIANMKYELATRALESKDANAANQAVALQQWRDAQTARWEASQKYNDAKLAELTNYHKSEIDKRDAEIAKIKADTTQIGNKNRVQDTARDTLDALGELLDPNGKLRPEIKGAVGGSRAFGLQFLPATQTRAADASIKRLKSMLVVDLIGEMKAQSKSGATGFGQLNMKELGVLENAASKLDPSLDEGTFEAELNRIKERLQKIVGNSSSMSAADLIKKYGGK